MAAAGPPNLQQAPSPLMEASIKMAEQLAPNRTSDRGRMHGLADEGFDAGPFPQADGDHPPALQLAALERGRSSKSSTRLQRSSWSWRLGHGARASETPVDRSFARTLAWVHRATRSSRSTAEAQLAGQAVTERR